MLDHPLPERVGHKTLIKCGSRTALIVHLGQLFALSLSLLCSSPCVSQENAKEKIGIDSGLLGFQDEFKSLRSQLFESEQTGHYVKAIEFANRVAELLTENLDKTDYRIVDAKWEQKRLEVIARLSKDERMKLRKLDKQIETARRKLQLRELMKVSGEKYKLAKSIFGPDYAVTLIAGLLHADMLLHHNQFGEADKILAECLQHCDEVWPTTHPNIFFCESRIGFVRFQTGRYREAITVLDQCIQKGAKSKIDIQELARFHKVAALAEINLGLFAEPKKRLEKTIEWLVKNQLDQTEIGCEFRQTLGILYLVNLRYRNAKRYLFDSLRRQEKKRGSSASESAIHTRLLIATCSTHLGEFEEAQKLCSQAKKECADYLPSDHPLVAVYHSQVANIAHHQGNFSDAQHHREIAFEIDKKNFGLDHPNTLISLHNLVISLQRLGETEKTIVETERILEQLKKNQHSQMEQIVVTLNLVMFLIEQGRLKKANELIKKCKDCCQEHYPDQWFMGKTLFLMACLKSREKRFPEAMKYASQAKEIYDRNGVAGIYKSEVNRLLGRLYLRKKEAQQAALTYESSLQFYQSFASSMAWSSNRFTQRQLRKSYRWCFNGFLFSSFSSELSTPQLEKIYDYVLKQKGQMTLRQRFVRAQLQHPESEILFLKLRDCAAQITQQLNDGAITDSTKRDTLEVLISRKNQLEKKTLKKCRELQFAFDNPCYFDVRSVLKTDEVLLDFVEFKKPGKNVNIVEMVIFVVRKDHPLTAVKLAKVHEIRHTINQWRKSCGESLEAQESGVELRSRLWDPLDNLIFGAKSIIICPDSQISTIPFGALPGKKTGTYLIEQVAFSYYPNVSMLYEERIANDNIAHHASGLLALGNPDYGELSYYNRVEQKAGYVALPATDVEVQAIAENYANRFPNHNRLILVGENASRYQLLKNAANFSYLHLAVHGFMRTNELGEVNLSENGVILDPFPEQNVGLVFAGANNDDEKPTLLTAGEIANLHLKTVEQVVLSGCNTGMGNLEAQEGIFSLQRSFHIAGAKSVIASLWPVPDDATQNLMKQYYSNLWDKKMPKDEALRHAKIWMIKNYRPKSKVESNVLRGDVVKKEMGSRQTVSPYYWGGFVLSGKNK